MNADALTAVQDLIARIARIPRPDPDMDMYTAGLASVDALELLVELEDAFGIAIPDDRFVNVRTAAGLAELVGELAGGSAA
ncbi:MAG: acyl carrier protein [Gemmatimonadales bacterium]